VVYSSNTINLKFLNLKLDIVNIRKRLKEKPELHTGALNDILFILLLFFLIVSTLANPNVVKVNNPKEKAETKTKQNIVLSIDKENKIYLNQQQIEISQLDTIISAEVMKVKQFQDTPTVVINADTISYTGGFFKIMASSKRAGAKVVANVKG
jgi:biopolymer transport protein ExbD